MAKPLIIFGAGASYDYSPEGGDRKIAPLTKHLADEQFLVEDILEKYEGVGDLLTDVIQQVRAGNSSFEEVLTQIQERTAHSVPMKKQFIALEFFLRDLFACVSDPTYCRLGMPKEVRRRMYQLNHYRSILNRINTYAEGGATVVTFNYDTLFESSLPVNLQPKRMDDYISNPLKIIKLHGSHDWSYIHRKSETDYEEELDPFQFCLKKPDILQKIHDHENWDAYHNSEIEELDTNDEFFSIPALAIPLVGKDRYVPPKKHISTLQLSLSEIDRVLIIGWRAKDPMLLETIKKSVPHQMYKVLVVSDTKEGAEEIAETVREAIGVHGGLISARGGGFGGFVSDETSHTFFSE